MEKRVVKLNRQLDPVTIAKNRAAIMAGICILGAAVNIHFNGADINTVVQHEIEALQSWEALGQYLQDLGPLNTILIAGSAGFFNRYLKERRLEKEQKVYASMSTDDIKNNYGMDGESNVSSR